MKKTSLSSIDTRAPKKFTKESVKKEFQKLQFKLEELQNLMYAEDKHALLIIIQGMDAAGKDGVVKNVFQTVNPMGCKVFSFKEPSQLEMKHDFLWRIHRETPERGTITIFNRSHYEDVLIQRVYERVDETVIQQRFENINNFEKLLIESNTTVLKFYLHVSKQEQLKRLQERLSDPTKMWKYDKNDMKQRKHWAKYMTAYEDVFEKCSEHAPWTIVPADQNWYKEYVVAKEIVDTLEGFKMNFPTLKKTK